MLKRIIIIFVSILVSLSFNGFVQNDKNAFVCKKDSNGTIDLYNYSLNEFIESNKNKEVIDYKHKGQVAVKIRVKDNHNNDFMVVDFVLVNHQIQNKKCYKIYELWHFNYGEISGDNITIVANKLLGHK